MGRKRVDCCYSDIPRMEALRIANSMGKTRFLHSINNRSRHLRKFFRLRRILSHQNRILSRFYKKFSRMRPIPKRPFLGNGLYEFFALELLFFSILIFYKKLKMLRKIGLFFLIFLGFLGINSGKLQEFLLPIPFFRLGFLW